MRCRWGADGWRVRCQLGLISPWRLQTMLMISDDSLHILMFPALDCPRNLIALAGI